jgi:hypothetical protein
MNHLDQSLNRLFKAAARAPQKDTAALPFAVEAGTLARWRAGIAEESADFLAALFRRAVLCAGVIMLACIGWNRFDVREEPAEAGVRAHYEIALQVLP